MAFLRFLGKHLFAAIFGGAGIVLLALGYADQARDILKFQPWQLQAAGALLFIVSVILILYKGEADHVARLQPAAAPAADADLLRKRNLLEAARGLATRYASSPPESTFRQYLETTRTYASLRGYLSPEYLTKLNAPRTFYGTDGEGRYEPLVEWFLDDLDRLEREWGLA